MIPARVSGAPAASILCPLDMRRICASRASLQVRVPDRASWSWGGRHRHRLRLFEAALLLEVVLVILLSLVPRGFIEREHFGRDRLPTTRLLIGQRFSRRSLMLGCGSKYSRHVLRLARRAWVVVRPENAQHIIVRELLRVEFYPHRFGVAVAGAHGGVGGCAAACVWTARVPDGRAHNAIHAAEQRVGPPKSAHAKHSHCNTPLAHRAKQNVSAISQTKNMRGEGVGGQSSLSMGAPTLLRVL